MERSEISSLMLKGASLFVLVVSKYQVFLFQSKIVFEVVFKNIKKLINRLKWENLYIIELKLIIIVLGLMLKVKKIN